MDGSDDALGFFFLDSMYHMNAQICSEMLTPTATWNQSELNNENLILSLLFSFYYYLWIKK